MLVNLILIPDTHMLDPSVTSPDTKGETHRLEPSVRSPDTKGETHRLEPSVRSPDTEGERHTCLIHQLGHLILRGRHTQA
jgi:hypothetical protein